MKPRQPVAGRLQRPGAKSSRCANIGKDEKSRGRFTDLFSLGEERFFCCPGREEPETRKHKSIMQHHGFMKALKCRECGREYPLAATHVCEFDFGPLEVVYDYPQIKRALSRSVIESRPQTMWRYRELLPVAEGPTVGVDRKSVV